MDFGSRFRSVSKVISLLLLLVVTATLSLAGAAQPSEVGALVIVKPPSVQWRPGQPLALLGDCDTPMSQMGMVSSDQTPLLRQVDLALKKGYHQTSEWTGVSRLVRTPPIRK